MISRELLDILVCPETRQDVALMPDAQVAALNHRIESGQVKNRAGEKITEKIDGGLVRSDNRVAYPIRAGIPVMLVEEAIPLEP